MKRKCENCLYCNNCLGHTPCGYYYPTNDNEEDELLESLAKYIILNEFDDWDEYISEYNI